MYFGAITIACLCVAQSPGQMDVDRLQALRGTLPASGCWSAVYKPGDETSTTRWQVVYRWETAEWLFVAPHAVLGSVRASGPFRCIPDSGGPVTLHTPIEPRPTALLEGSESALDELFPSVMLRGVLADEQHVLQVVPLDAGGVRVHLAWPGGSRNMNLSAGRDVPPEEVVLVFDSLSRLVSREQGFERGRIQRWEYEYDDRTPQGFAIPSKVTRFFWGGDDATVRVLVSTALLSPTQIQAAFVPASARAMAIDLGKEAALARRQATNQVALHSPPGSRPESNLSSNSPLTRPELVVRTTPIGRMDRYRWPLILTGLIVASIGALAWWKRARG